MATELTYHLRILQGGSGRRLSDRRQCLFAKVGRTHIPILQGGSGRRLRRQSYGTNPDTGTHAAATFTGTINGETRYFHLMCYRTDGHWEVHRLDADGNHLETLPLRPDSYAVLTEDFQDHWDEYCDRSRARIATRQFAKASIAAARSAVAEEGGPRVRELAVSDGASASVIADPAILPGTA